MLISQLPEYLKALKELEDCSYLDDADRAAINVVRSKLSKDHSIELLINDLRVCGYPGKCHAGCSRYNNDEECKRLDKDAADIIEHLLTQNRDLKAELDKMAP